MTEHTRSTFSSIVFNRLTPTLCAIAFVALLFCYSLAQAQDPQPPPEPELLDHNVNSPYAELLPIVSPDGQYLYFIRKYSPENTGGLKDPDDIYYSTLKPNGKWNKAVNIGPPLNSPGSDALMWISNDGNTALVHSGKDVGGKELGLAISRRSNNKWGEPEKITIEGFHDEGEYYQATISPDEKYLFVAHAPNPEQNPYNFDLFYAPALSNDLRTWGKLVPLSAGINTPFAEAAPFIGHDNRTLYFVSDRPEATGSGDFYTTRRIGDDWSKMTTPQLMGGEVNSPFYETGLSITSDNKFYYFGRVAMQQLGGHGKTDLFRQAVPDTNAAALDFLLVGKLVDRTTKKGIAGDITISLLKRGTEYGSTTSDKAGSFEMALVHGQQYKLEAKASGYTTGGTVLDFRTLDPGEKFDVTVELFREGSGSNNNATSGTPPTILFATGSTALSAKGQRDLKAFYRSISSQLEAGTLTKILVFGHTDSTGTAQDNQRLSEQRAETVRKHLTALGVPGSMIQIRAEGENMPVANNGTAKGRAANRRVEIKF